MKRLLAVFAHPDDESAFAGTMAHYASQGAEVALACATRGEAGEISDPSLATPKNLGQKRESELRCSCDAIGISQLYLLGYCDSGMVDTPENERPTAFIQADPDDVRCKLVKLMREFKPHVVMTFEPNGWYGHPDHIAAGRYTTEAFELAGQASVFPEAGPPWVSQRLYHAAFLRSRFKLMADYANEQGIELPGFDQLLDEEEDPLETLITHRLDVDAYYGIKEASRLCHQTQFGDDHLFSKMPAEIMQAMGQCEDFIQVYPKLAPEAEPITDLFAGLSID